MTDAFIGDLRIIDACAETGCPVCRCLEDDSRRDLATLLDERVTDPDTRRHLRDAWGLCNWHAWMLLDADDHAVGVAILHEDLLRVCRNRVERLHDRRPSALARLVGWFRSPGRPRLVDRYHARAHCPVCVRLGLAEDRYIDAIVQAASDSQFRRAYDRSDGLCLPHVVKAVERRAGAPGLRDVLNHTLRSWDSVRGDLQRFLSKNEYRNTEPISDAETRAGRRALEILAGRPGLFGHARWRSPG